MTEETRYPLVDERAYGRPATRVGRIRKRYVRDEADLPGLAAHHVRVFRVGGRYVEEHGLAGPGDETVVNASSVTVVDCRVRVPVVAEVQLPSSGVDVFTLHITFLCTVRDAAAVVRDGVIDAAKLLKGYVREIPGLDDESSDLPTTEVAQVRRKVEARLAAYLEMRPPTLSGLEVDFNELRVLTPQDLEAHLRALEKGALERQRELFEAERRREQKESAQRYKRMEEEHRQEISRMETEYAEQLTARTQRHDLNLTAQRNDFRRAETVEDLRVIGNDAAAADLNAVNKGEMRATEYSDRLREREDREFARRQEERLFDRDDHRFLAGREDRFRELAWQDQRADREAGREDVRFRLEREDRIRELDRQDLRADKNADREDQRYRMEREDQLRGLDYQELRADKDREDRLRELDYQKLRAEREADREDSRYRLEREDRLRGLDYQELRADKEREDRLRELDYQKLRAEREADRDDYRYRLEREERLRGLGYQDLRAEREADREDYRYRLEREERLTQLDYQERQAGREREDRLRELEYHDRRTEAEADRAEGVRQWNERFVEEQRRFREARENQLTERQAERRWQQQVLQIQDNLLRLAISRGAADDLPLDIGDLIKRVGELPTSADAPGSDGDGDGEAAAVRTGQRPGAQGSVSAGPALTDIADIADVADVADDEAVMVEVESVRPSRQPAPADRTDAYDAGAGVGAGAGPDSLDDDQYGEAGMEERRRGD